MACNQSRSEQIAALAAGRLDERGSADLLAHAGSCAACSAEIDLVADLVRAAPRSVRGGRLGASRSRLAILVAALVVAGFAFFWWEPWHEHPNGLAALANVTPIQAPADVLRGPDVAARGDEYARGIAAYRRGDFAAAIEPLGAVAERRPKDALTHLYLGIAVLQTGDPSRALPALNVAADSGAGLVRERGLWYLGNAQLLLEHAGAARSAFERLRDLDGDYAPNARAMLAALAGR